MSGALAGRLEQAVTALEEATKAARDAAADLELATRDEVAAPAIFDSGGTDEQLERATRSRVRRERCERIATAKRSAAGAARAAVSDLEREAKRAILAVHADRLRNWVATLKPELRELVALRREVAAVVERISEKLVAQDDEWLEAHALAVDVGDLAFEGIARPSMALAQFHARVMVGTVTREDDDADAWIGAMRRPAWPADGSIYERALADVASAFDTDLAPKDNDSPSIASETN